MNKINEKNSISNIFKGAVESILNKCASKRFFKKEIYSRQDIISNTLEDFTLLNDLGKNDFVDFVDEILDGIEIGIYDEFDSHGKCVHFFVLNSKYSTLKQREMASLRYEEMKRENEERQKKNIKEYVWSSTPIRTYFPTRVV